MNTRKTLTARPDILNRQRRDAKKLKAEVNAGAVSQSQLRNRTGFSLHYMQKLADLHGINLPGRGKAGRPKQ